MGGIWNHLETSSLTGLPSGLDWDCGPGHLYVVCPSDLGFLSTWRPQGGQTSFRGACGSNSKEKLPGGGCMALDDLGLEATWHPSCHISYIEAALSHSDSRGRDTDPTSYGWDIKTKTKNQTCRHHTILISTFRGLNFFKS